MTESAEKIAARLQSMKERLDKLSQDMQDILNSIEPSQSERQFTGKISEHSRGKEKDVRIRSELDGLELLPQLNAAETDLAHLERDWKKVNAAILKTRRSEHIKTNGRLEDDTYRWPLSPEEYKRYGRQLIMPEIGINGQLALKSTSVLIVGIGGLGSPAALYLAGSGVGTIGLVDGDEVELSNLHRQIAHSSERVGQSKVKSAIEYLKSLNSLPQYCEHQTPLTPENAFEIFSSYDIILDCTDHPTSRYLISDVAVLLKKPVVSASALQTDGQLLLLNHPSAIPGDESGGPCYRCIFPKPPPPETVLSCGEGGILGPVVGVMGVLQALETIKLIVAGPQPLVEENPSPSMLLFSAFSSSPFRNVKLRGRRQDCAICSSAASIVKESIECGSLDYARFCGIVQPINLLSEDERISASAYHTMFKTRQVPSILIDTRERVQFDLCSLESSINIPFSIVTSWKSKADVDESLKPHGQDQPILVVCRFGNDSQAAVQKMKEFGLDDGGKRFIGDIRGGFKAWREEVDELWPDY